MEIRRGRSCIGLLTLKMPVSTTLAKVKDLHQPTTMPQPTPSVEQFHVCMERTGRNPDWSRSRHVLLLEGCKKMMQKRSRSFSFNDFKVVCMLPVILKCFLSGWKRLTSVQ